MRIIQIVLACTAIVFGLLTVFVGTRVLLGSDPGYVVFKPLLIFNTTMGIVYVVAGITIWRNIKQGMNLAAIIFFLNLVALAMIYFLYLKGNLVAIDSLRAMSMRTVVWLILFVVLVRLKYKQAIAE